MPKLYGNEKYVPHYTNIKLHLTPGLKLKKLEKVHRVLHLKQSQ